MKPLKIAFATTISADTISVTSAVKNINEKFPNAIDLCLRTGNDFDVSGVLDDFISFSVKSDVVIVRLMGDLPDFDKLAKALKVAKVPLMVSASFFESNIFAKFVTVQAEDEQKIFFYLNYGGKKILKTSFIILQIVLQVLVMLLKLQLDLFGMVYITIVLIMFLLCMSIWKRKLMINS